MGKLWENYKGTFASVFICTFIFTTGVRLLAFYDVITDIIQLWDFYYGIQKLPCHAANINNSSFPSSSSSFSLGPAEPWWFFATLLSIFLPSVVSAARLSGQQIRNQYLRLPIHLKEDVVHTFGASCSKMRSYLLKVLILPVLPVLILIRQFRQVILKVKIEQITQGIEESIKPAPKGIKIKIRQLCRSMKKLFISAISRVKDLFRCCCCAKTEGESEDGTEEKNKDGGQKELTSAIQEAMKDPAYELPERTKLNDELTKLSSDRHYEALLETTPQAILNLMIMMRYGSEQELGIVQLSLLGSFSSLLFSSADYTADKLKKNPLKREFNKLGFLLSILAKFPAIFSRCVGLALLLSIEDFYVKVTVWYLIAVGGLAGAAFECYHLDRMPACNFPNVLQLLLHLFVRGYTSVFTLMEYRTKSYDENNGWKDEADKEVEEHIYDEPKERHHHQLWYLIINSFINIAIGCWFYFLSDVIICKVGIIGNLEDRRLFFTLMVVLGAPWSFVFTVIMKRFNKTFTQLGNKAIEALNYFFRLQIRKASEHGLNNAIKMMTRLTDAESSKVAQVTTPGDESILCLLIKSDFPHRPKVQFYTELSRLGFPLKPLRKDCFPALAEVVDTAISENYHEELREILLSINGTFSFTPQGPQYSFYYYYMNIHKSSANNTRDICKVLRLVPLTLYPVPEDTQNHMGKDGISFVHQQKVYICGRDGSTIVTVDTTTYKTDVITTNGTAPRDLLFSSCALVEQYIYVYVGGGSGTLYTYNPLTNTWAVVEQQGEGGEMVLTYQQ